MLQAQTSSLRERYQRVLSQISEAATSSGRSPEAVKLVVVSKSQPLEVIQAAIGVGVTDLGENYVEEAVEKIAAFKESAVEWHMIGHVQSRKADKVVANFHLLHSLDSVKLAARLDRFCREINRRLPVLIEMNVSGEESKFGLPAWDEQRWPDLNSDVEQILECSNLQVCGLTTMPPFFADPERTRPYFRRLRLLREFLAKKFPQAEWRDLSMGTSVDFIAAIQERATIVRIGQAILGPRIK